MRQGSNPTTLLTCSTRISGTALASMTHPRPTLDITWYHQHVNIASENGPVEIVSFPIKHGDFQ